MSGVLLWFFYDNEMRVQPYDSLGTAMRGAALFDADTRCRFHKVTVGSEVYDRTSAQFMAAERAEAEREQRLRRETKWKVVAFDESTNSWAVFAIVESEERARAIYELARKDFPEQIWGMRGVKP